jgi:nitroimidazol reductase NimA-like FMN-containing flavoprotein (pyridoxamine 5'-phosphate oxidase superfamily)
MARMTRRQAEDFLVGGAHRGTMVFSVAVDGRGPLSVPLAFRFEGGVFRFDTKRSRRHTRAFLAAGRATVLVHFERYGSDDLEQYVMAEGPVRILDDGTDPDAFVTAELVPERFIGVEYP